MSNKLTYQALEQRVEELERESIKRKEVEQALKEAEEELQKARNDLERWVDEQRDQEWCWSLIDASADAIVIYDMEGRTKYISHAFTQIFGWTLEQVEGKGIPFLPESEKEKTLVIINRLIEKGTPCHGYETKRYTKDQRLLDISISASLYDDYEGKPAGILVILRDITHTKRRQAQRQHAEKMESIGIIAGGVAHHFRNILTGISANSQLLEFKYGDNEEVCEITERIRNSVEKGAQLVGGLMQFSRMEGVERFEVLNLVAMIRQATRLAMAAFGEKIKISFVAPESIPVLGDYSSLKQIIMNLCTNACDAMPDGGELHIEAKWNGDRVEVTVSDTGPGMDKETLEKCFDPFFTTKSVDKGTGLGLSRAYGIAKAHGGDLHAYSESGKGAIFKLYLPAALNPS